MVVVGHYGKGVVAREKIDQLCVKRQPGRIDIPCGMRHTHSVQIVMVWEVRLKVKMGGAIVLCDKGRNVVEVVSDDGVLEMNPTGKVKSGRRRRRVVEHRKERGAEGRSGGRGRTRGSAGAGNGARAEREELE